MQQRSLYLILLLILLIALGAVFGVRRLPKTPPQNTNATPSTNSTNMNTTSPQAGASAQAAKLSASPIVTVETTFGTITIKLYAADAPELTKNFVELAKSGYYDGLTFHRIVPGFVIQGGDPSGNGTGGHSYKGEGANTGLADEAGALALKHYKGAVAWAKSSLPNSIGSQFYIALGDLTSLDGKYSVFGQVVEGFDVVEKIAAVETDAASKPLLPVTMKKVLVSQ